MADTDSIWFRLGYALEQSRHAPSSGSASRGRLRTLAERGLGPGLVDKLGRRGGSRPVERGTGGRQASGQGGAAPADSRQRDGQRNNPWNGKEDDARGGKGDEHARAREALDALFAAGAGGIVARLLGVWRPRHRPGPTGLLRGGLAGAAAAYLRELVAPMVRGRTLIRVWDDAMPGDLMAGAARGLLYAGVVDGRLPGSPLVRGAAYGVAEHLLSPVGGLGGLLGDRAPHRRIPLLSGLFEDYDPGQDTLADHLAFAVTLAVLYGERSSADGGDQAAPEPGETATVKAPVES